MTARRMIQARAMAMALNVLAPFSNRLSQGVTDGEGRAHALAPNLPGEAYPLHGDAWLAPWRVTAAGSDRAGLAHDGAFGPWRYAATLAYRLADGALSVDLAAENRGQALPFGLGLHPWFVRSARHDAPRARRGAVAGRAGPPADGARGRCRPAGLRRRPRGAAARRLDQRGLRRVDRLRNAATVGRRRAARRGIRGPAGGSLRAPFARRGGRLRLRRTRHPRHRRAAPARRGGGARHARCCPPGGRAHLSIRIAPQEETP